MAERIPALRNIREKVKTRVREITGRRALRGQVRVGGGAMIEKARQRAEQVTARIKERKPQIIPKIKEFRPGERIKEILAPQGSGYRSAVVDRPGMSVEGTPTVEDRRNIVVEW